MNKILLGFLLGGLLGIFDGLTAWFTPAVRSEILFIVMGSTMKGMIAGVAAGWFARKVRNVSAGIAFGFAVGLFLAYLVAAMPSATGEHYYFEIMLPGSILGAVVGWATQRYGKTAGGSTSPAAASAVVLLLVTSALQAGEAPTISASDAFEKLKTLDGSWSANMMEPDGPPTAVHYKITAGGSAVLETLFAGTPHEMVTVYTVSDEELMAKHYCSGNSQPTMKLDPAKSTPEQLVFSFVSVEGANRHKDHIHHGEIQFGGEGKVEATWMMSGETPAPKKLYMVRATEVHARE